MTLGTGVIVIAVGFLSALVFGVLGYYEKNQKRKFLFELLVFLFLGVLVFFQILLLTQGHFFQSARHLRRLLSAVVIVFAFIVYAEKTYENWKRLKAAP